MVSNKGRVKNLNYNRTGKEQILKQAQRDKYGHMFVGLCKNGKVKLFLVHQLVAQSFLDNPYNKPIIDHLDCDPTNNRVSNLRWCNQKENSQNLLTIEHTNQKTIYCYETDKKYYSINEAARQLNINKGCVSQCCAGKISQTGGYHLCYADEISDTYELFQQN